MNVPASAPPGRWPPPRGLKPVQGAWPQLQDRDLSLLHGSERFALEVLTDFLDTLETHRRAKQWSLRKWAEQAGLRPNTLGDVQAGSVWPEFLTLHAMADCLGLTIRLQLREPLPRRDPRFHSVKGKRARLLERDSSLRPPKTLEARGELRQLLILRELTYVRRARGIPATQVRRSCGASLNTLTRASIGAERGQTVSLPVMFALCHELGVRPLLMSRLSSHPFLWDEAAGISPAQPTFDVVVSNVRDRKTTLKPTARPGGN